MSAHVIAAGTAAGVYGKSEPIEALARALSLPYFGGPAVGGASEREIPDLVAKLKAARGIG